MISARPAGPPQTTPSTSARPKPAETLTASMAQAAGGWWYLRSCASAAKTCVLSSTALAMAVPSALSRDAFDSPERQATNFPPKAEASLPAAAASGPPELLPEVSKSTSSSPGSGPAPRSRATADWPPQAPAAAAAFGSSAGHTRAREAGASGRPSRSCTRSASSSAESGGAGWSGGGCAAAAPAGPISGPVSATASSWRLPS
mmetsp:Transcript_30069/g.95981  ORF Transcript_30069/g.95981 Transcript_30069/m.95981 type:complete len:203 (+) Transcript_30069:773-1381(+)